MACYSKRDQWTISFSTRLQNDMRVLMARYLKKTFLIVMKFFLFFFVSFHLFIGGEWHSQKMDRKKEEKTFFLFLESRGWNCHDSSTFCSYASSSWPFFFFKERASCSPLTVVLHIKTDGCTISTEQGGPTIPTCRLHSKKKRWQVSFLKRIQSPPPKNNKKRSRLVTWKFSQASSSGHFFFL